MKYLNSNKLISLLILGLIFCCCEREQTTRSSELKVNDYKNMLINYYDTLLIGGYGAPISFSIDLDGNGKDDIVFESVEWGSAGIGHHPRSTIMCLHSNIELLGSFTSDTLYLNRSTTIYQGIDGNFSLWKNINYSCFPYDDNDSIAEINQTFEITPLNKVDLISINDTYIVDTITLVDDSYSLPPFPIRIDGDTTIYEFTTHYNNCYAFPLDEIKYIGLKLNQERLGWVKISIFDQNKILIHESGLQE